MTNETLCLCFALGCRLSGVGPACLVWGAVLHGSLGGGPATGGVKDFLFMFKTWNEVKMHAPVMEVDTRSSFRPCTQTPSYIEQSTCELFLHGLEGKTESMSHRVQSCPEQLPQQKHTVDDHLAVVLCRMQHCGRVSKEISGRSGRCSSCNEALPDTCAALT